MKKIFAVFIGTAFFVSGLFAQQDSKIELQIQPYLELYYMPFAGDPLRGTVPDYRAFSFEQSGIKVTGTTDRLQVYWEARGVPDTYVNSGDVRSSGRVIPSNAAYYGWGKYFFTDTGNIWGGRFKPFFGPNLIDQGVTGMGWQQKLSEEKTLGVYLLKPVNIRGKAGLWTNSGAVDDGEGFAALATLDFAGEHSLFNLGLYYAILRKNINHEILGEIFASYWGIENLTLTGEIVMAVNKYEDFITAGYRNAVGFGCYGLAEYQAVDTLGILFSIRYNAADLTAEKIYSADSNIALGVKYSPGKSFYIQPMFYLQAENLLNGRNENKLIYDFKITFRWEPGYNIKL